jgi:PKD repeat protein
MKRVITLFLLLNVFQIYGQRTLCEVSYTYSLNEVNQLTDFVIKADGHKVVNWQWDFGDGSESSVPNPRHIYMQSGSYVACLTIITEDSCESTFCDTIVVGLSPQDTNSLYLLAGNVFAGQNLLPSGIALLVSKVNLDYVVQRYTTIINGHYEFNQVAAGDYLVYAIPNFNLNINYYPAYLPSYFGNETNWEDAAVLHVSTYMTNCNIHLDCNNMLLYGPDTISGSINILDQNSFEYNVYYADWFGNIGQINMDKAPNMPVLLLDNYDEPIRFVMTDENGNFRFTNLPVRIYKISPEKPGYNTIPETFNMQNQSSSSASCSFYIGTNSISIGVSNPDYSELIENIEIYPNPVTDNAIVSFYSEKPRNIFISVEDLTGKEVISKEMFETYGHENYFIPFSSLKSGLYFVKIQADHLPVFVHKIIKQ